MMGVQSYSGSEGDLELRVLVEARVWQILLIFVLEWAGACSSQAVVAVLRPSSWQVIVLSAELHKWQFWLLQAQLPRLP